ncbi:hypothetical protein ACVXHA_11955 [Escherichia coli]
MRARANNSGRNPRNWTSYEKLRTVIEKKCSPIPRSCCRLSRLTPKRQPTAEETRRLVDRMMEKGYTRKQVRLLCEWYLRVRKSS